MTPADAYAYALMIYAHERGRHRAALACAAGLRAWLGAGA